MIDWSAEIEALPEDKRKRILEHAALLEESPHLTMIRAAAVKMWELGDPCPCYGDWGEHLATLWVCKDSTHKHTCDWFKDMRFAPSNSAAKKADQDATARPNPSKKHCKDVILSERGPLMSPTLHDEMEATATAEDEFPHTILIRWITHTEWSPGDWCCCHGWRNLHDLIGNVQAAVGRPHKCTFALMDISQTPPPPPVKRRPIGRWAE